jgi:glycerol-3-phosphate dehydrogenase
MSIASSARTTTTERRAARLARLANDSFDVLVIGGGATGAGTALDAATRGLKVALVERFDFAQGTSSRSTKLVHGGVRYLEQAVKHADRSQFNLVREALRERAVLLKNAPHLAHPLPLLTPIYSALELPYYFTGLKLYDMLAGRANLQPSRLVGKADAAERFPMLKREGLRGAVEYHDGQFDDARMNVALALTAARQGAVVLNHVAVTDLIKGNGRVSGAVVNDSLDASAPVEVRAKVVINATGPFVDAIRSLDEPGIEKMLTTSSGVHIVLPKRFSPPGTGLLIPKTEDGRVLFLLPWLGHTLVGTTDNPAAVSADPLPESEDVEYILRHVRQYFDLPVSATDVMSSWSGLRPLVEPGDHGAVGNHLQGSAEAATKRTNGGVKAGAGGGTARLSRDHTIVVSASGLVTITGGKWTTYRKMAEDAVDTAVETGSLQPKNATRTASMPLIGGDAFAPDGALQLQDRYGLEADTAHHLHHAYGDRAFYVAELAARGYGERLAAGHPYLEAEVLYVRDHEDAHLAEDVLSRRLRLAFLDSAAALRAKERVTELLASDPT